MNKAMDELRRMQDEYDKTADAYAHALRLDLAFLVIGGMSARGWNIATLAGKTGFQESYISNVIHANSRCGFAGAGKILHALGIRATLVDKQPSANDTKGK